MPTGAALFDVDGNLIGKGHNRRVQHGDPSSHGETDAFHNAGRQPTYRHKLLVSSLTPCSSCSGLIRQFGIPTLIVAESTNSPSGGVCRGWPSTASKVVQCLVPELIEMFGRGRRPTRRSGPRTPG